MSAGLISPPNRNCNLAWRASEEDLKKLFEAYGPVISVKIVADQYTGKSKGFGFVEMEDEAEQRKVLEEVKTVTVDGREVSIKVSVSVPHTSTDKPTTEDAPESTDA